MMTKTWIALLLGLGVAGAWTHARGLDAPSHGDVEIVRLKVGTELLVETMPDTFDEAVGIQARRVENGALVDLRWDQMHADDVRRIRATFGFLPDEPEPVLREVDQITLGGGMKLIGVIEGSDGEIIRLRNGNKVTPIRADAVRRMEKVVVDALEVFEGEELYTEILLEAKPETALDHYNLSVRCEGLQLWDRVLEHLDTAASLDPEFKRSVVASKRKRAEMRKEFAADAEVLSSAERLANRERFHSALEKIDTFLAENESSSMAGEFQRTRRIIENKRAKWLRGKLNANVFTHIDRYARQVASEEQSVESARRRMEKEGTTFAMEALAAQFDIEPEEVLAWWDGGDRPKGAPRTASYGGGTFTLGEEKVFEGMKQREVPGAEANPKDEDAATGGNKVQDRIRRLLEEKRRAQEERDRGAQGGAQRPKRFKIADVPPTKDEWWADARQTERKGHLVAWWAEKAEGTRLLRIGQRACPRCAGHGVLDSFSNEGGARKQACPRCKGLRIDRLVTFN